MGGILKTLKMRTFVVEKQMSEQGCDEGMDMLK